LPCRYSHRPITDIHAQSYLLFLFVCIAIASCYARSCGSSVRDFDAGADWLPPRKASLLKPTMGSATSTRKRRCSETQSHRRDHFRGRGRDEQHRDGRGGAFPLRSDALSDCPSTSLRQLPTVLRHRRPRRADLSRSTRALNAARTLRPLRRTIQFSAISVRFWSS